MRKFVVSMTRHAHKRGFDRGCRPGESLYFFCSRFDTHEISARSPSKFRAIPLSSPCSLFLITYHEAAILGRMPALSRVE